MVTRADYLSGRTALHFAAVDGHVRYMRLVVADFVPSAPFESINAQTNCDRNNDSTMKSKYDQSALSKFVNKAADGGITALHMAALNGYSDCVELLLDIHANVSSVSWKHPFALCSLWRKFEMLSDPSCKRCQSVDLKLQWEHLKGIMNCLQEPKFSCPLLLQNGMLISMSKWMMMSMSIWKNK
ncbi:E3 ubiquitin-protein ligase XBAT33 [Camellia lanceoleosa]|uniref:E3 ubiquitin-protein ligase XBAT33 n=1 Tax=Camellia lanceoleosa TaxID=1840588 RepID=A0ACC0FK86_9ERIC|nr:E3 ubiquitin-protein ligase XBAT33 [Camellia lanceoleosa]